MILGFVTILGSPLAFVLGRDAQNVKVDGVADVRVVEFPVGTPADAGLPKDTLPATDIGSDQVGTLFVALQAKQADEDDAWRTNAGLTTGDRAAWLVSVQNLGPKNVEDVNVSVNLAPHLRLVSGTVRYIDANQDVVQTDEPLFGTGGFNFGIWRAGGGFYVRFETEVLDDFDGCDALVRTNVRVIGKEPAPVRQYIDGADVKIRKPDCG